VSSRSAAHCASRSWQVAPSTHYDAKRRPPSARTCPDEALCKLIQRTWEATTRCTACKVWRLLLREGHEVTRCTVDGHTGRPAAAGPAAPRSQIRARPAHCGHSVRRVRRRPVFPGDRGMAAGRAYAPASPEGAGNGLWPAAGSPGTTVRVSLTVRSPARAVMDSAGFWLRRRAGHDHAA
jgi:hypothetical protein